LFAPLALGWVCAFPLFLAGLRVVKKQIPFGNDSEKSKNNSKGGRRSLGFARDGGVCAVLNVTEAKAMWLG